VNRQYRFRIAGALVAALLLAGCAGGAILDGVPFQVSRAGQISDLLHRTLFTYDRDIVDSGSSSCYAACATIWKPVLAGPEDVSGVGFSFIMREGGSRQWAYLGQPLYHYTGDLYVGDIAVLDVRAGKADGAWNLLWHASPEIAVSRASP
jgi:predicted lipoprotein with Yx(FWY)xxD motif